MIQTASPSAKSSPSSNGWLFLLLLTLASHPLAVAGDEPNGITRASSYSGNPVDDICITFCDDYFRLCATNNEFTPGVGFRKGLANCHASCMGYPRPVNPSYYETPLDFGSNLGSDTLWCRARHMSLAEAGFNDAAFHCPHAGPSGGGICTDSLINRRTPYHWLRVGASTRKHFGYCDVAGNNTVADCTSMDITDATLPAALSLLPTTVSIIFLSDNPITALTDQVFAKNLKNPSAIRVITLDETKVATIAATAFAGLPNLQTINLNVVPITSLPAGMLDANPKLLQFSAFRASNIGTGITSIPSGFFAKTPLIETIIIYGHPISSFPAGIFDGLTKCKIISFVLCSFTNAGFPAGVFDDLVSLEFFDFFGNKLTSVESSWFAAGWATKVRRLALNDNAITTVGAGAFDTMTNLQDCYLHRNSALTSIDPVLLSKNLKLRHFTIGAQA